MKILTGKQIREADLATIQNEPVDSIELMERAAEMIAQAICNRVEQGSTLLFLIGKGNNGGDGLAVARMLSRVGFDCRVCMLFDVSELSEDCALNYERLPAEVTQLPLDGFEISDDIVIVDAMLGSGVAGEVHGVVAEVIKLLNTMPNDIISIDLPSGMTTEYGNDPEKIVHASVTLTIEFPKVSMLLPEAGDCCGEIEILPIELDGAYIADAPSRFYYTTEDEVKTRLKSRRKFGHKGDFGHALLVCGSINMPGAALLSTLGALRSGCGLVTTHIPERVSTSLSSNAPSAMLSLDPGEYFAVLPHNIDKYGAVGIGCGLGTAEATKVAVEQLLNVSARPMVLDADALNILAQDKRLMTKIPPHSILTPHPGEFQRLVGEWGSEEEKLAKLMELSTRLNCVVILKGAYTAVCSESGEVHFNSTGTSAMAKGGSGDILTGFVTGLLARGYSSTDAARIGVYLHGKAGEKAAAYYTPEAMNSADIIDFLAEAWAEIQ